MVKIYSLSRWFPKNHFREEDEKIIEKIIEAIEKKSDLDIRKIAQMNYTSASSISRLAKRAGFNNFKEFIFFLSSKFSGSSINQLDNLPFVTTNYDWNEIDSCFMKAFSDNKIYLFGEGFCQFLVDYTYRKLLLKRIYAIDLEGVEISLVSDKTPHTLIIFSQSGENRNGLIKIEECKSYGGNVIALTATENSSYISKSDLSFIIESGTDGADSENQNLNYFFGNCLNLMEYLINRYAKTPEE
ncbi:MAG: SIS domain-containing protein [Lactobacillales bacterium]|jgi:DNA-binding MurR/RpiR family transcriptional regulator|nr:SIS domain-containing protein [Lactobacillales bacterium]